MKILIVDDNANDRKILKINLERHGCQVLEAVDGLEGLEQARLHLPDMVISDALMPKMDGFQFLRTLKMDKALRAIPFIFYSANYTGAEEAGLAASLGAKAYIIKPKDPAEFWQELNSIMAQCVLDGSSTAGAQTIQEDHEYLLKYSNIVANKLEAKVRELEQTLDERKQAELELRNSARKYRAIFENVQDVFYQVGRDGNIIEISPSILRYSGYSREELIGKPIIDYYYYPEDRAGLLAIIKEKGEVIDYELRMKSRDNRMVYASVNAHLLLDESGKPVGMEGSLRDITERKDMEEQIHQAKIIWEETFDTINDAITIHDQDFRIVRMNKSAETLISLTPSAIPSHKCYELFHGTTCPPDDCPARETLKTGRISVMERFEPKLNKFIEVRTLPRYDKNRRIIGLVHIVVDITERKKAEQDTRNLQAQLFQSQKMESIGRLAGGVAHDFNNILTAIIGYSEILLKKTAGDPKMQEMLSIIMDSGKKAAVLTQQLLALSRKQVLTMGVYNLNDIIEGMAKMITRIIGEDVVIEMNIRQRPDSILADKSQIEQIILNLAVNARDAMPSGGSLTIETENVFLDKNYARSHAGVSIGPHVMLSVSDTGIGMNKEVQDRLFEPFFTTKDIGKGTGLGLATVYGIVKQHNGHVFVYSEPGQGTAFKVYFPAVKKTAEDGVARPPIDLPCGTETILVVDDDATVRGLVVAILESLGYRVAAASNGEEAMKLYHAAPAFDLLLTDVVMPGMNGKALADAILALQPAMKVIFMSGYPHDAIAHHGILDPGVVLIQKPLTGTGLAVTVREVLDRFQGKP